MICFVDFETYSELDLEKVGGYKMLRHPSADIVFLSYAIDDGWVKLWSPVLDGPLLPADLLESVRNADSFVAWYANFDRVAWNVAVRNYGWPELPLEQWECAQVKASYWGHKRPLDQCGKQLGLGGKDEEGKKLLDRVCKPVRGKRNADPETLRKVGVYAMRDVALMRQIYNKLPAVPDNLRELWLVDQQINDTGVPIDPELCRCAHGVEAALREELGQQAFALTSDRPKKWQITSPKQTLRIKTWLNENGCDIPNLAKETVEDYVAMTRPDDPVGIVLRMRLSGSAAAPAKFGAALECAETDNRARGQYHFYKAGPGRWAGRLVQFQNLRHGKPKRYGLSILAAGDVDEWRDYCLDPYQELAEYVRAIMCAPPGKMLAISDLNAIEFRLSCWLADERDLLERLRAGEDLYKPLAAKIYDLPLEQIDKDKRNDGKTGRLSTMYGSGAEKLRAQTKKKTGIDRPLPFYEKMVEVARSEIPAIMDYHRELKYGAEIATNRPGVEIEAKRITFIREGDYLFMRLPSGRALSYFNPRFEVVDGKFGRQRVLVYDSHKGRIKLLGHTLMENCGQGTAADCIFDALLRIFKAGERIVGHEHDKIITEIGAGDEAAPQRLHDMMEITPVWAGNCPIKTETVVSRRFAGD